MIMNFLGVIVNSAAVIVGGAAGLLFNKKISEKLVNAVMGAIGLCSIAIGVTGVIKGENQLVLVLSLVAGTVVGTLLDLDRRLDQIGTKLSKRMKNVSASTFSEGFVSASLLFCVGAMTIVGSVTAGISGDNQMLFTKSILDLISALMLAASLGVGVIFASAFVLVFQGSLVALAMLFGSFLSSFAVNELICAGSAMIIAIGLNLLKITKIKTANLLPALLFVPLFCFAAEKIGI